VTITKKTLLAAIIAMGFSQFARAQGVPAAEYWGKFDAKNDPAIVGKKVAENLLTRPMMWDRPQGTDYREACTAYGSLRYLNDIHDKDLLGKVVDRYNILLTPRGKSLITTPNHVDMTVFGIVPLEIYLLTASDAEKKVALEAVKKLPPATPAPANAAPAAGRGAGRAGGGAGADMLAEAKTQWDTMKLSHQDQETQWLTIGKHHADSQWAAPRADGLTDQTRMWVDYMFMITGVECQAYRATGDKVYLDRAAKEMVEYLKELQQPNGLFFHASDSPFYWGRGDGWFAVGMAELLSDLPADHPERAKIMEGYKKMMAGLLKFQAPDGMWRQLIDHPEAWEETTGTGMFTFAMARGVRQGWLDEPTYKEPARKAWVALSTHITADGQVTDVCVGTNKAAQSVRNPTPESMLNYYLTRDKLVGDYHGQAAYIWAAWAMVK
jgi:hypothetical protein